MTQGRGFISLVGAGPGSPSLITLAGVEALGRADVVVYDKLVHPRILDYAPPTAERIFVGKQAGNIYTPQQLINETLIAKAQKGYRVVRLKGGDSLIFGRGSEELEALRAAGIDYEIIPGVTAATAAAATAAIPLTHRRHASVVTLVTGYEDPQKESPIAWSNLAQIDGTLVIYMARSRISEILHELTSAGMDGHMPIAFIQWAGSPKQKVHVSTINESLAGPPPEIGTPMLAIIGRVVELRAQLQWFEHRPLAGQTVLLLRPAEQSADTSGPLERLGAEVISEPVIEIEEPSDPAPMDEAIAQLHSFDWLVFSSRNGVRQFMNRLLRHGGDCRRIGQAKLAVVGSATAREFERYYLHADLVSEDSHAESLLESLKQVTLGQRVLIVRAEEGRTVIEESLADSCGAVVAVSAYRQRMVESPSAETLQMLREGGIDWVLVSSRNIARGFVNWLRGAKLMPLADNIKLVSISPAVTEELTAAGLKVHRQSDDRSVESMIEVVTEG